MPQTNKCLVQTELNKTLNAKTTTCKTIRPSTFPFQLDPICASPNPAQGRRHNSFPIQRYLEFVIPVFLLCIFVLLCKYKYKGHLLHFNVHVQWDRIRGINIYRFENYSHSQKNIVAYSYFSNSPDPADLGSRPWHRIPTSATQT